LHNSVTRLPRLRITRHGGPRRKRPVAGR
jgi:hypothetical protein